jgi:hypothetical protein
MSTRLRRVALVGAVLIGLSATTANGNATSSPRTDPVLASFGATMATGPQTFCTGADGNYVESDSQFTGALHSTDPRLDGVLSVHGRFLVNLTTGFGSGDGTFQIRDDVTGLLLVNGTFDGAIDAGSRFKGLAVGHVSAGGRLIAILSVTLAAGTAVGNLGSPIGTVASDPAVIQSGGCP